MRKLRFRITAGLMVLLFAPTLVAAQSRRLPPRSVKLERKPHDQMS